jgi:xylulose-5-phosphate/fructose-6-phosphate phosphoketolase
LSIATESIINNLTASRIAKSKKQEFSMIQATAPRVQERPLAAEELQKMNAYWRAANYLSVGQIYLLDNPLLKEPLKLEHVKPRLLGHWGTTPGLNFIYVHFNRIIKKYDLNTITSQAQGMGVQA